MFLFFLTTLKYHSNKFLELNPKDEVTLLSYFGLFKNALNYSFPHSFLWVPIFWPKYKIKEFLFSPT